MKNNNGTTKAFNEGIVELEKRLENEDKKRSTGSFGKRAEPYARNYLMKNGIRKSSDVRARGGEKPDCKVKTKDGQTIIVEVKTGSGCLCYAADIGRDFIESDRENADILLMKKDYIAYNPFTQFCNENNFYKYFYVFSRAEFINLLLYMFPRNGLRSALHITKHGKQLDIQYLSAAPERRFYEYIEQYKPLTLEQFKSQYLK